METKSEQDEKLSTFLAIAGEMVEPDVAKAMLESANWNLESALNGLLEGGATTEAPRPSPGSSSASEVQDKYADMSIADLRALLEAYDADASACSDKIDLVNLLEEIINGASPSNPASVPFQAQPQFGLPISRPSEPQSRTDGGMVADKPLEPSCPTCHLGHTLERHSRPDNSCDISGPGCKGLGSSFRCASGCDFNACDVCCLSDFPEKWEHRLSILQKKFPSIPRSRVIKSLKKHDGCACVADDELQKEVAKHTEQTRINAERRSEIDMQNEEFRESLLMDQHRQAQNKEAEAIEEQVKELERKDQAEKAELAREAAEVLEAKRLRVNQPEPDKSHPDRCTIVIRTPSGKRLTRTFLGRDEVSYLYDWIDVSCTEEEFVQESYQLVSRVPGSPKKELCKTSQSLKEEGVEHQSVFFITRCS